MANMSYCRFENTFKDLADCEDNWDEGELSTSEEKYRAKILRICERIVANYGEADDEDQ